MATPVKMGIEIEYLLMTSQGGPISSGWQQSDVSKYLGLQILRDAANSIQPGIMRQVDAAGHINVYKFSDGKIMLPDTFTLLETVTAPSTDLDLLRDQLWVMKNAAIKAADKYQNSMLSGAACPVAYKYDDIGSAARVTANNAGMHVHLEALNDKVKIKFCNMLMQVMPELTALAVNSSVYNRQPSPYFSHRLNTSPLVGPSGVSPMEYEPENPLQFNDPAKRYQYLTPYTKSKCTVELRGFDTPLTIDWAMAIGALMQCLGSKASRLFVEEQRNTVVGNNSKSRIDNFNAAMTHGLSGKFTPDHSFGVKLDNKRQNMSFLYHSKDASPDRKPVSASLAVKRLLYYVEAEAYELGLIQYLEPLYQAVRTGRDQARQQLEWFRELGFEGYLGKLKEESARPPNNRWMATSGGRTYLTVRQSLKGAASGSVYLSSTGLSKIQAREGDELVISGPLGSLKAKAARDSNTSGTIPLADDEIRLGKTLRNQLGVSMYDPIIIGRAGVIPIVIEKTSPQWTATGAIRAL